MNLFSAWFLCLTSPTSTRVQTLRSTSCLIFKMLDCNINFQSADLVKMLFNLVYDLYRIFTFDRSETSQTSLVWFCFTNSLINHVNYIVWLLKHCFQPVSYWSVTQQFSHPLLNFSEHSCPVCDPILHLSSCYSMKQHLSLGKTSGRLLCVTMDTKYNPLRTRWSGSPMPNVVWSFVCGSALPWRHKSVENSPDNCRKLLIPQRANYARDWRSCIF